MSCLALFCVAPCLCQQFSLPVLKKIPFILFRTESNLTLPRQTGRPRLKSPPLSLSVPPAPCKQLWREISLERFVSLHQSADNKGAISLFYSLIILLPFLGNYRWNRKAKNSGKAALVVQAAPHVRCRARVTTSHRGPRWNVCRRVAVLFSFMLLELRIIIFFDSTNSA